MSEIVNKRVLVLNQDYRPVNICRVRRALILVMRGKAEIVENGRGEIRGASRSFPIPSVIHISYMVKHPHFPRRLTRTEVFNRDHYVCQYCGKEPKDLTLDHVIPRFRGGEHVWENVVSCCPSCNRRKASHTPAEAGMQLLSQPSEPRADGFRVPPYYLRSHLEWQKFLS